MRAWLSVPWVGVSTLSRTNRPLVLALWFVTAAVLPRACTTAVKVVPSLDTCRSKSRVLNVAPSPPACAGRTAKERIAIVQPRSHVRILVVAVGHHLLLFAPSRLAVY